MKYHHILVGWIVLCIIAFTALYEWTKGTYFNGAVTFFMFVVSIASPAIAEHIESLINKDKYSE